MINKPIVLFVLLVCFAKISYGQDQIERPEENNSSFWERVYVGGNLGLGFGDIDYVDVSPIFGYQITESFSAGVGFIYRYRNDKRFTPDLKTSDYGGSLFTRYMISEPFFAQAEYEYLDYELIFVSTAETIRDNFSSVLVGGGIAQPIGGKSFFTITALYNLSYTNSVTSPYNSPWVIRGGVTLGF